MPPFQRLKTPSVLAGLIFFLVVSPCLGSLEDVKRNAFEIYPTSEGFQAGLERLFVFGQQSYLSLDVKNTAENSDDFGKAGVTFRLGKNDFHVFSTRLETAWIDGHQNLGVKTAYDNNWFGLVLTGVKSLEDSEVIRRDESVQGQSSSTSTSLTNSNSQFDFYDRVTTTTTSMKIEETIYGTHDSLTLDIHLNFLGSFHCSLGGSYLEMDDWDGSEYHAGVTWQPTRNDSFGGHVADKDGETEGGIYYKKRFSSLRDIFSWDREPATDSGSVPLIERLVHVPFSTPPIRITTATQRVDITTEDRITVETSVLAVSKSNGESSPASSPPSTPSSSPTASPFTTGPSAG